jgi:NADH dehydrogenase
MASNLDTLVTVFGGSGFVGRNVVRALAKRDYRIRVAVRRPELAGHLQPLGKVGQIHAVQANLRYPASVEAAMRDSHAAINLVGILAESGAQTFEAVQGLGAGAVAKAAAAFGARMVHVSAIGADDNSLSRYARAKAAGEKAVLSAVPSATIGGVRARGSIHQPLRVAGMDIAGAAADRRRSDKTAAGLCRRRRNRGRRRCRRQDKTGRDL